jgi:hypothetical protein
MMVLLISVFAIFLYFPVSTAQPDITRIIPPSHEGKVGETVQIEGIIETEDGAYNLFFDEEFMVSGNAEQNLVKASFKIPNRPAGNYTITIQDVKLNENASTWFVIKTAYGIQPELPPDPKRLQQGDSVVLHVNVTGGEPNTVYHANVSVKLPYPLNTTYSTIIELSNTTNTGFGYANLTYPDDFPSDAHTNFTGMYLVYFNRTESLAEHGFFIGMLNASDYHREELVDIRAVGYLPNETVTLTIIFMETNETLYSQTVKASRQGIIHANWTVPWNASMGGVRINGARKIAPYKLIITGENTTKPIEDSQLFSIPGYQIDIYTRNLAGDAEQGILVEALDKRTNTKFNKTSKNNGLARLRLEKGSHYFEAFWKGVKVGELNATINGEAEYNITCRLTDLTIFVKDGRGTPIPFVHLNISYQFITTKTNELKNETLTGETDFSGMFPVGSTLPNIDYIINASRYGKTFNNTVLTLPAEGRLNVTILCPTMTLILNVTNHDYRPFQNAHIEAIEYMGGLFYTGTSNSSGIAILGLTFGKYYLKVYAGNILINETSVDLFQDRNLKIYCKLYNLTLTVKTVDYFGQPIPNVNVTITREGTQLRSALTNAEGIATFQNIIGGRVQIDAYLDGQNGPFISLIAYVNKHRTIPLKIERYVLIAGTLMETSQLATLIAIVLLIIIVLAIEFYRKKKRGKLSGE